LVMDEALLKEMTFMVSIRSCIKCEINLIFLIYILLLYCTGGTLWHFKSFLFWSFSKNLFSYISMDKVHVGWRKRNFSCSTYRKWDQRLHRSSYSISLLNSSPPSFSFIPLSPLAWLFDISKM
jgi:hypothetical protein